MQLLNVIALLSTTVFALYDFLLVLESPVTYADIVT